MHDPHHHAHTHGHAHHGHAPDRFGRAFAVGIALNGAYVLVEAGFGVGAHSLALLADAGHNLGDVLALVAAWGAAVAGRRPPGGRYTYGLRSTSILAALANAMVLLVVTGGIAWEAIRRIAAPEPATGATVIAVAAVGLAVNAATALLFMSGRRHDLNLRSAFLHMAADALVSAGVVVAGGLMLWTGWLWLDPAVSLVVSGVIVLASWSLLRGSVLLALDAVPDGIDRAAIEGYLAELPGVTEVHDLHIWGMSTTETALTAHLVRPARDPAPSDELIATACHELERRFGIGHATLQLETGDRACRLAPPEVV